LYEHVSTVVQRTSNHQSAGDRDGCPGNPRCAERRSSQIAADGGELGQVPSCNDCETPSPSFAAWVLTCPFYEFVRVRSRRALVTACP